MYFAEEKFLVDKNFRGEWIIIDVDTGYKISFNIQGKKIEGWPDKITRRDILKARSEHIDISRIECNLKGFSGKDVQNIIKKMTVFLKSEVFPFAPIEEVKVNLV